MKLSRQLGPRLSPRRAIVIDFTSGTLPVGVTYTGNGGLGTRINSAGVMVQSIADTPRFDYDPVTLALRGLLVEPARTNLIKASSEFTSVNYTSLGTPVVTADSSAAPDGTITADTLEDDNAAAFEGKSQAVAITGGETYAVSVFIKKTGAATNTFGLSPTTTGGTGATKGGRFNTNSGIGNASIGSVEDLGTFWRPNVIVASVVGNTGVTTAYYPATGTNSGTSPGADNAAAIGSQIVWGAQLELGATPTSYIPTGAAAVTRTADAVSFTVPVGVSSLHYTFDDDSTQIVTGVTAGSYTVPTNLNRARIKRIVSA